MNEHIPFFDSAIYNQDDDLKEDPQNPQLIDSFSEHNPSSVVPSIIDEEMCEPELTFFCKEDPDATSLLKKCIKWSHEENWTVMKTYLNKIIDNASSIEGIAHEQLFIKHFYLGICYFRTNEYKEALSHFSEAQKIHQHYQLLYNIALCYMKLNNLENAVFYLEGVTKKNKNFFFAYYNLIKIYLKKNNTNDAFLIYRDFSEIIKKETDKEKLSEQTGINSGNRMSVTSFNTLKLFYKIGAECLFAKELFQECVYTIIEAIKFNPEDAEIWFLYAKVFVKKKSFEFAIPLLKKALEIQPEYEEAKKLLKFLEQNIS